MRTLARLFENNRAWSQEMTRQQADFFDELCRQQTPQYLWIGCADSRVPANEIVGLRPGELFVHRNVGNLVIHSDMNCLAVLQYAVDVLRVRHVIVVGHYGCGGVRAAMGEKPLGLIDNWLRHIRDVHLKYADQLTAIRDPDRRTDRLCELNIMEQVNNVCHTTIVQDAWNRGQELAVHGWVYSLADGLLRDLNVCVTRPEEISVIYRMACQRPE